MSSNHHKQFAHLRIPLKDVESAINIYSDANVIRKIGRVTEYKGQLLRSGQLVHIVARSIFFYYGEQDKEFWTEVSMLYRLKHENIVSILGFCDEARHRIIIIKNEANGILDKFLRDPALTWMRRLQICVGVAHALSHIYYDERRDFSVIHGCISSSQILLDHNWEAKLSGFLYSLSQTAARRNRLCLTEDFGSSSDRYIDPTINESRSKGHKTDMFSFGVILFEALCGNEIITTVDKYDGSFSELARWHYEKGRLDTIIDPPLWTQMDPQSFKIFSETAYFCLKEQLSQRPNIHQIVIRLEKALEFQRRHEIPVTLQADSKGKNRISKSLKGKNLEHLQIPLIDIEKATDNFAETHIIGSGAFGEVYKGEIEHFDRNNLLSLEKEKIEQLSKKRSTVAIKRILIRDDEQGEQGFVAEIELLTSCKHPNIVSLLGFCEEGRHMILVYEHAFNGSLDAFLGSTDNLINLTWVQRIKICIDIACGLNYLHNKVDGEGRIIHRDIKSGNILLGENWEAKIADFGLSKFLPQNNEQANKTLYTQNIAGTKVYLDPEYDNTGNLKNETDIYSFGVVLFEILSGRFANDSIYMKEDNNGIAPVARRRFREGTIKDMVDSRLMEETGENIFNLSKGPDQNSLNSFIEIAHQCVAETQVARPTSQAVIDRLKEALSFQENLKDDLRIPLIDILSATERFSAINLISLREYVAVYKGKVTHVNQSYPIAIKQFVTSQYSTQGGRRYMKELKVLSEYKHKNIIGLVGYCNEESQSIIVTEYASRGNLATHLNNNSLTWMKRVKICLNIASGLDFLHGGSVTQEVVIHRDVNASNILLDNDWNAKICDFGNSSINPISKDADYDSDDDWGKLAYSDPMYMKLGYLTKESDIYSFGLVLFEILCGRLLREYINDKIHITSLLKTHFEEGKIDEMVFEDIKQQIAPKSFTTFQMIAYKCLQAEREQRPTACEVLLRLTKVLEFQEDFDIWVPKLPSDYKEIFQMSNSPDIYSTEREKCLYEMLCNGILLQQGKVLFKLSGNGERNKMISAKSFFYINQCPHRWRSLPESRFHVVAEMLDILNLKIKINTTTELLSPDIVYGVYLVFKFCDPRNVSSKPLYVNLKYKNGNKPSHAYFATWRDSEWLMIELCRFLYNKTDFVLKFLLQSISRYYCGDSNIYVEGVEFRAINNAEHEEIKELKEVQQSLKSDSNLDMLQQLQTSHEEIFKRSENDDGGEKMFLLREINGKKYLMLSAKALDNSSNVKLFKTKLSTDQSRFPEVIELLPHQVFRINCTIESLMLSQDTDHACYLVFKLSEKCRGLYCPVKVRDLLHRNNKEAQIIYFRSPSPWNLHDTNRAPEQRADGWMEVKIWKFNLSRELKNDRLRVNLKLISYEGTMSGLIVCGLEFRPM